MQWIINIIRLRVKQVRRFPMWLLLRGLVRWEQQTEPVPGYTVVIACMKALAPVAIANLRLCARQSSPRLYEILLVFDCTREEIPPLVEEAVVETAKSVRVRLIGYNRRQHWVAATFNWGWVYSWLSWSLGLACSRTRAVLIHDLDALPAAPGLFDGMFERWEEHKAEFCGIRHYIGNGITPEMELVTTFELMVDASFLRRTFRPFDLFNKLMLVSSRLVDFDTML